MARGRKTGGRQSGTPNKATSEIREAARLLLDDPEYRRSLRTRLISGKAGPIETLLFHYAYGKPKETVEQTGEQRVIFVRWQDSDSAEAQRKPPARIESAG
jgi:hypothetical protein